MARRKAFARFVRPPARTTVWFNHGLGPVTVAGSSASLYSSYNAAALAFRPFTIIRTRLLVHFESDQVAAIEKPSGAFGGIVVKEDAQAIGITAIPTPISDTDAEWAFFQGMTTSFTFITGVGFDADSGSRYIIDSKAMRKVGINETYVTVVENRIAVGSITSVEGRQLIKLH